ncbi:hypothetical protein KQX54_013305 [Cotesia glomerata]|uniref:HAT C-terminal dimerisation domain-containing protein n=1 Tax=Cotesia glomerata TaxID=32391 RepID=A0AAV7IYJ5_COTGL|nr:hypothetical protein KQX54_013305 [Cotesia glomerata]
MEKDIIKNNLRSKAINVMSKFYYKKDKLNHKMLSKLNVLKPSLAMLEKTRISTPSLLSLMQALPRIVTTDQYLLIDDKWRKVSSFELPTDISTSDDIDVFWYKLSTCDGGDQKYFSLKNLSKCVLDIIALPHSNADCERIFSAINLSKTKSRNKLVIPTVNGLLLASQLVENCTFFEPAYQEYSTMNQKILYPNYKKKPSGNKYKLSSNVQNLPNNNVIELVPDDSEISEPEDIGICIAPKKI